jgi:hypothetical protein
VRRLSLALAALGLAAAIPLWNASGRAPVRSELTLLAFLDLAEPVSLEGRGSRSQAVFLRSMVAQHPRLRLVLVDVSGQDARERSNRAADWHLDGLGVVPLAALDESARAWFSGRAPETLLLRTPDRVLRRWTGFASAAQLDLALREAASPHRAPAGG